MYKQVKVNSCKAAGTDRRSCKAAVHKQVKVNSYTAEVSVQTGKGKFLYSCRHRREFSVQTGKGKFLYSLRHRQEVSAQTGKGK